MCLIIVIMIVVYIHVTIKRNDAELARRQEEYRAREIAANSVRKQDISKLDYITIPIEKFPLNLNSEAERKIKELAGKDILNLTGLSNTDLKLAYGPANLDKLMECDENFIQLVVAIGTYASELIEAGQIDDARELLEFAVNESCDSKLIYTSLADIYKNEGNVYKIEELVDSASNLNSLSKNGIIASLKEAMA